MDASAKLPEDGTLNPQANRADIVSSPVLWFAVVTSLFAFSVTVFRIELTHCVSVFLVAPFFIAAFLTFAGSLIAAAIVPWRGRRYTDRRWFLPLLIHVLTLILLGSVPFEELKKEANWRCRRTARTEVVRMVESGELALPEGQKTTVISLPRRWANTTNGGRDIMVQRKDRAIYVLFYYYRGMLGHFSGVLYRSDDSNPRDGDVRSERIQWEKKEPRWFWVVAGDG